ncbi:hypothetical protein CEXT_23911 [Caerostris extrusa]|uniref:Uncharacterized protein n=1 Tax=Caerostris extrusa TaxID=172846 RepID=A0AAV4NYT6_CAEEX|nr:hypothetical protein CEXT_23911 [Caerostris extrusa]
MRLFEDNPVHTILHVLLTRMNDSWLRFRNTSSYESPHCFEPRRILLGVMVDFTSTHSTPKPAASTHYSKKQKATEDWELPISISPQQTKRGALSLSPVTSPETLQKPSFPAPIFPETDHPDESAPRKKKSNNFSGYSFSE